MFSLNLKVKDINKINEIETFFEQNQSVIKNLYRNYFSFVEVQKVKFFLAYDTLEECVLELFNFLEINKGFIKENDSKIYLVVPLNSKKYPEIVFNLI